MMTKLAMAVALFGFIGCGVGDETQAGQQSAADQSIGQSTEALSGSYKCELDVTGVETGKCIAIHATCSVPPFNGGYCVAGKPMTQIGTYCTHRFDITNCGN